MGPRGAAGSTALAHGVLTGIRVLDFGIWRPVPYATQLLADLGADVLHVEPPGGDPMRQFPDIFATIAAHKRSIVIDLKSADGLAHALELAADADVVTEGFRPGVVDRLGIGPGAIRAVNPDVVYCSISGFGQDGPMRLAPGHDLSYQAVAGVLVPEGGDPPARVSVPWADLAGGLSAAFAICAALVGAIRTGEGDTLDVSMTDILATWTGSSGGGNAKPVGRRLSGMPGYGVYKTRDGWIAMSTITEQHFWANTCDALGMEDVRDLPLMEQLDRHVELRERLDAAIGALSQEEALKRLNDTAAPVAPIHTRAGMLADEHLRERGTVFDGPDGGPWLAHPVKYAHHPPRPPILPPEVDEHDGQGWLSV
jgi:crotonobetainyl-CoA:carnitine CoA-transferase CaiB-like acyl-CoA transferase